MPKYELIKIKEIIGICPFYSLVINDENVYEEFFNKHKDLYLNELKTITGRIKLVAEGKRLPKNMVRTFGDIKGSKLLEIKSKNLRIYTFHQDRTGKVIVHCGHKNTQKKDVRKFKKIVKDYVKQSQD